MDYDKWGFWAGFGFFVLSIPTAVLIQIYTPRGQIWWAERSRAATQRRIAKLRRLEAELRARSVQQDFVRFLVQGFACIAVLTFACVQALAIILLVELPRLTGGSKLLAYGSLLGLALAYAAPFLMMHRFDRTRLLGLPRALQQIEELERSLREEETR